MKHKTFGIFVKFIFLSLIFFRMGFGEVFAYSPLELSQKIADSLSKIKEPRYKTIAFSRIRGENAAEIDLLIDYSNVNLVKTKRFNVTDRSRLERILTEQRYNLSDLISPASYKQIGNLLGVDLFVYGAFYDDVLIMKAIDAETSGLVWIDIFSTGSSGEDIVYRDLMNRWINSIRSDITSIQSATRKISFWGFDTRLNEERLIDYFSYALVRDGSLQVVDRENLSLVINEQKLGLEGFIDPNKIKKMGELYKVDGFVYGAIRQKDSGEWFASLKMMNIDNGVITWADLLQTDLKAIRKENGEQTKNTPEDMVEIEGGTYIIGSNEQDLASPRHQVQVSSFFIDKYEVSNIDYYQFVKKYKHRAPRYWVRGKPKPSVEKLPVVLINWHDAEKYCRVLGKRLPLESEWEVALRGKNANIYPWEGKLFLPAFTNTVELKFKKPMETRMATKDVSSNGVHFLAGNVREWVGSLLRRYPGNRYSDSGYNKKRVIRGSSWIQSSRKATGWFRDSSFPSYGYKDVGFRCAKDLK